MFVLGLDIFLLHNASILLKFETHLKVEVRNFNCEFYGSNYIHRLTSDHFAQIECKKQFRLYICIQIGFIQYMYKPLNLVDKLYKFKFKFNLKHL